MIEEIFLRVELIDGQYRCVDQSGRLLAGQISVSVDQQEKDLAWADVRFLVMQGRNSGAA